MVVVTRAGPVEEGLRSSAVGTTQAPARAPRSHLAVWRSPPGQPAWSRPALLGLAAVAAFLYAWGAGNYLEIYYAAAVRSMSTSWHDFVFAAFDPAGTVSVDKLPGAFWVQALFVRLFGAHAFVLVLPQVIEGTLTVLVLYRAVRRLAGPLAGILSAGLLVVSPATVALNRGNIPDTLMVLLLVLAADATVSAVGRGRPSMLLLAGLFVALAFQAKMVVAWLVLPAFLLAYLVAAPGRPIRRLIACAATVVVTATISLSWMCYVSLTNPSQRPSVDGSTDNSVFQQVFVYNGLGRLDEESPDQLLERSIGLRLVPTPPASWDRLLTGGLGLDVGWLVPAALISLVAGLVARRREERGDAERRGFVLWGLWLVPFALVFSVGSSVNPYYMGDLSPPIAALTGVGLALAWQHRSSLAGRLVLVAALLASGAYAAWLLPVSGTGLPTWLKPTVIGLVLGAAAAVLVAGMAVRRGKLAFAAFSAAAVALALAPAVAAASVVVNRLGPFDTPFQRPAVTAFIRQVLSATPAAAAKTLPTLEAARQGAPYLMATQSAALAAPFIYYSGLETLPIGGFTGTGPEPTLQSLETMIGRGDFHLVLESPTTTDPRLLWIAGHCIHVGKKQGVGPARGAPVFAVYYCLGGGSAYSP